MCVRSQHRHSSSVISISTRIRIASGVPYGAGINPARTADNPSQQHQGCAHRAGRLNQPLEAIAVDRQCVRQGKESQCQQAKPEAA